MFDEIDARFHIRFKPVIFAWGYIIYNPMNINIPPQLVAHETVHGARQIKDIAGWWRRYIDDDAFRLAEEILAHRAEYRSLIKNALNRNQRRSALKATAKRLSSPLYGRMMTQSRAATLIKN